MKWHQGSRRVLLRSTDVLSNLVGRLPTYEDPVDIRLLIGSKLSTDEASGACLDVTNLVYAKFVKIQLEDGIF